MPRPNPNDKCHCGKNRKYKKCCALKDRLVGRPVNRGKILDPKKWADYGKTHESLRYFIGQQVEVFGDMVEGGGWQVAYVQGFNPEVNAVYHVRIGLTTHHKQMNVWSDTDLDIRAAGWGKQKCTCGSNQSYRNCCATKEHGKVCFDPTKEETDPTKWPGYGVSDPTLRFAVGDEIEALVSLTRSMPWQAGTIKKLHCYNADTTARMAQGYVPKETNKNDYRVAYLVLLDDMELYFVPEDKAEREIRPLGFRSSAALQKCVKCGVDSTSKDVQLSKCGGCNRVYYCSR